MAKLSNFQIFKLSNFRTFKNFHNILHGQRQRERCGTSGDGLTRQSSHQGSGDGLTTTGRHLLAAIGELQ